jgi:adenylosuccinate lyase
MLLNRKLDIQMGDCICAEFRKLTFPSAYTRKVDLRVANALSAFGATVQKITGDIRHLASQKEMEE